MSLTRTNFIVTEFVGFANYAIALSDEAFLRSIANSGLYVVLMVATSVIAALSVALLVFPLAKRWHDFARFVFYIPMLSAGIIIAQVWRWVFHRAGPINWLLGLIGLEPVAFVSHWWTAIPMVSLVVASSVMGAQVIIFLAAMLSIDKALFDAAKIDGASQWQIKVRVVVPIIAPTIGMMALLAAIAAPQVFETIYAMAPQEHAATMAFHIYRQAFQMSRYGVASAQAIILLVLTAGMTWAKQRLSRES